MRAFAQVAAKLGHVDTELDRDSVIRSVYLQAGLSSPVWPSLALAMLEQVAPGEWQHLPGETRAPTSTAGSGQWLRDYRLLVNFLGPPGRFREVSFADVLEQDALLNRLHGRFVLVGVTAAGLGRSLATPVSGEAQPMSGVEFNATVLDNLRNRNWVTPLRGPALRRAAVAVRAGAGAAVSALFATPGPGGGRCVDGLDRRRTGDPAARLRTVAGARAGAACRRLQLSTLELATGGARGPQPASRKELARATLHAIGDAVVTTDHDGLVTYMNPVAEALSEHARRDAVGRHISSIFWSAQKAERDKAAQVIGQALAENRSVRSPSYALLNRRLGDPYAVRITASPIVAEDGTRQGAVIAFHDVTENLSLSRQVAHQATHDALTRLPNRELLADRVAQAIAAARRDGDMLAVLFLDLDGFKYINSSHGHATGDALLVEIGERLALTARPTTPSRAGTATSSASF
ncbi:MAG: CHASE2 domain-containing protein [Proteobacteria bacterium]|nr:CHASE2 domain-containing protein [Pseudomonadota bacterium]